MESLAVAGAFAPPSLATLESAISYGLALRRGRVFADLWDLHPHPAHAEQPCCFLSRVERLREMNLRQQIIEPVVCEQCEARA